MKQRNFVLQLAVASVLTMPIAGAFAATVLDANVGIDVGIVNSTNKPIVLSNEQPIESAGNLINKDKRMVIRIPTIQSYKANSDSPMFIKVALKGGIKFTSNVSKLGLVCQGETASVGIMSANIQTPAVDGGTTVTFQIKNGVRLVGTSGLCAMTIISAGTASTASVWYKGLTRSAQSVSAVIDYYIGLTKTSKVVQGSIITFANAGVDIVSTKNNAGTTAANTVIDVRSSSQKFSGAKDATQAFLGSIKYKSTGNLVISNTAGNVNIGKILKTATLTLNAPAFAAAQEVSIFDGAAGNACISEVSKGVISGTTVTFNNVTPSKISAGVNICMVVGGKTAISAGQVTAEIGGTPQSGWAPIFGGVKDLYNLKKNGLSFRVLNIPPNIEANPQPGDTGYIRLYNVNNFGTTVLATMYKEDGTVIGTAGTELVKLTANQVAVFKVADLQTKFGTWTGRARMLLDVDAAEFKVVSTVRSPTGVLLNLSSETSN